MVTCRIPNPKFWVRNLVILPYNEYIRERSSYYEAGSVLYRNGDTERNQKLFWILSPKAKEQSKKFRECVYKEIAVTLIIS